MAQQEKRDVIVSVNNGQALSSIKELEGASRKLRSEWRKASTAQDRTKIAKDLKAVNTELSKLRAETRPAAAGLQKMGSSFKNLGAQMMAAFGVTALVFTFVNTLRNAVNTARAFEAQMSKVKAISKATDSEMIALTRSAKQLGSTTIFTATQVGQLQEEYARLGFTMNEILKATPATLALAAATGEGLAESAKTAGSVLRGFGLDAAETGRVADVMALSFSKSALNLSDFGESMKYVAPIAKAANIDIETTTALLGKLADAGLRGSIAGTGLKNIISKLSDENSALSKELGFSVKNSDDLFRAFVQLKDGNIDLTKATELTDERAKAAFITLIDGIETVDDLKKSLDDAGGAAEEMAATMQDNFEGSVTKMKSAWEGFILQVTETKSLRGATDMITNLLNGWTYLAGGLRDNLAMADMLAQTASRFKGNRLDDIASGYRDMNDIYEEMLDRQISVNAQIKEMSALETEINQIRANGTHVPDVMEKELASRQEQIELDKIYVGVLKQIRDEAAKTAEEAEKARLAKEEADKAALAEEQLKAAEKAEEEAKKLREKSAIETKKLIQELQDLKISAIENVEAREIAAAETAYQRRVDEINGSTASEQSKNDLIKQLTIDLEHEKTRIISDAHQDRLDAEAERVAMANDSDLLTLQLKVDVAPEDSEEQLRAMIALLTKQMELELSSLNLTNEQKLLITKDYQQRAQGLWDEHFGNLKDQGEDFKAWEDLTDQERIDRVDSYLSQIGDMWGDLLDTISSVYDTQLENEKIARDQQLEKAEQDLNNGILTQEQFAAKRTEIEERYAKKEREIKHKQFEIEKTANIIKATMAMAQAINVAMSGGPVIGQVLAGITAGLAGLQIGIISAQPNPYLLGGYTDVTDTQGNKHRAKNIGSFADNYGYYSTPSYGVVAEDGKPELVVPNHVLTNPNYADAVAQIESAIYRRDAAAPFINGGYTSSSSSGGGKGSAGTVNSSADLSALNQNISLNNRLLQHLISNGVIGRWTWKEFSEGVLEIERIDNKKYLNGDPTRKPGQRI